jgi:putative endonuclease
MAKKRAVARRYSFINNNYPFYSICTIDVFSLLINTSKLITINQVRIHLCYYRLLVNKPIKNFSKCWCVYIVECADGTFYTGISPDIASRIEKHNSGAGAKYTKPRRPVKLVYSEKHQDRSCASKRESEIKKLTRERKIELILSCTSSP